MPLLYNYNYPPIPNNTISKTNQITANLAIISIPLKSSFVNFSDILNHLLNNFN